MSKDFVRGGMKCYCQPTKYLRTTFFEQAIDRRTHQPSYQRLKTMVKKFFLDQKKTWNRHCEATNERTVTGAPAKSRSEWKSVSVEREQEDCYHWKAKGKCMKGDACEWKICALFFSNNDGKNSLRGRPPRGFSHL